MKKIFFLCLLSAGMLCSCNNSAKEEKKETKDTTVAPTTAPVTVPDSLGKGGDTTGKGEQAPPPKMN